MHVKDKVSNKVQQTLLALYTVWKARDHSCVSWHKTMVSKQHGYHLYCHPSDKHGSNESQRHAFLGLYSSLETRKKIMLKVLLLQKVSSSTCKQSVYAAKHAVQIAMCNAACLPNYNAT